MEWISVKDSLPSSSDDVLAYTERDCCIVAYYDEHWFECNQDNVLYGVTHWAKLPEAPKVI